MYECILHARVCIYIYIYWGAPTGAVVITPISIFAGSDLSLRANIYIFNFQFVHMRKSMFECANLCFGCWRMRGSIFSCWRMCKFIFLSFRAQIHFFNCGTCANLFLRFGHMRKSIFLFFRFGSVLSYAQIYVCRCWHVRYFNFPFRNSVVPCADLFLVCLTVLSHAHTHFPV